MGFGCSTIPLLAKMMIPTIALPVETQQSHSLAAVSQFSGVSVYRCAAARSSWEPPRARKSQLVRCESDPRWFCSLGIDQDYGGATESNARLLGRCSYFGASEA